MSKLDGDTLDLLSELCRPRGWTWEVQWDEGFDYGGAATLIIWTSEDDEYLRHGRRGVIVEVQAARLEDAVPVACRRIMEEAPA